MANRVKGFGEVKRSERDILVGGKESGSIVKDGDNSIIFNAFTQGIF